MEGTNSVERRALPGEIRVSGRTVSGTVVAYGDVADMGAFREVFLPGSSGKVDEIDAELNVMHFENRVVARTGGGLVFRDTPGALLMSATLPTSAQADDALAMIRAGKLRGLSVEFRALAQEFQNDLRRIESAMLGGLGLVDRPAYQGSAGLEVRRGRRRLWQLL